MFSIIFIGCLCAVHKCVLHSARVQVRGQLAKVSSSPLLCGFWDCRLSYKHLYLLSHLFSLEKVAFFVCLF